MIQAEQGISEAMKLIVGLGVPRSVAAGIEQILQYHSDRPDRQQLVSPSSSLDQAPSRPNPRNIAAVAELFHRRALKRIELLGDLASDFSWQMLLALVAEEGRGRTLSVSALCLASGARPTTALRHITAMEEHGLIRRVPDPKDGRRTLIFMTEDTRDRMHEMLLDFCVPAPVERPPPRQQVFAS